MSLGTAIEMVLGSRKYDQKVDCWSAACVGIEIFGPKNPFKSSNTHHLLASIITVLGYIRESDFEHMKEVKIGYNELDDRLKDDQFFGEGVSRIVDTETPVEVKNVLNGLLKYSPKKRFSAHEALETLDNFGV
ncbi:hypothetical protein ACOME3_004957 [Neoechinorhynchus agilis]